MIFVTKTKLYGIMPIDVQLSNVLTMQASENSLYFHYLDCIIYIYIVPCNLNRKIAIPIKQRNMNGILIRSSFKLSYQKGLKRNIITYQNVISFQNCIEYIFHNLEFLWLFQFKNLFENQHLIFIFLCGSSILN